MDTVDKHTRSRIMSSVGQKDTGPEMLLRTVLHGAGLRYRLHDRTLPGTPDLVFPRFRAVVFVHGCYWHSHGCYRSTVPKSRRSFWQNKFTANRQRDSRDVGGLNALGWRVMVVWECALKGKRACPHDAVAQAVKAWLGGSAPFAEFPGRSGDETLSHARRVN
jgi:DNA mismatch endonuclease (patch repair protein)